jgi:hypothetical protein
MESSVPTTQRKSARTITVKLSPSERQAILGFLIMGDGLED